MHSIAAVGSNRNQVDELRYIWRMEKNTSHNHIFMYLIIIICRYVHHKFTTKSDKFSHNNFKQFKLKTI